MHISRSGTVTALTAKDDVNFKLKLRLCELDSEMGPILPVATYSVGGLDATDRRAPCKKCTQSDTH